MAHWLGVLALTIMAALAAVWAFEMSAAYWLPAEDARAAVNADGSDVFVEKPIAPCNVGWRVYPFGHTTREAGKAYAGRKVCWAPFAKRWVW